MWVSEVFFITDFFTSLLFLHPSFPSALIGNPGLMPRSPLKACGDDALFWFIECGYQSCVFYNWFLRTTLFSSPVIPEFFIGNPVLISRSPLKACGDDALFWFVECGYQSCVFYNWFLRTTLFSSPVIPEFFIGNLMLMPRSPLKACGDDVLF